MTVTLLKSSFSSGELSPSVWGRVTAQTVQQGCSVMRNMFISRRGPASSRAGTKFVGLSPTPVSQGAAPAIPVTSIAAPRAAQGVFPAGTVPVAPLRAGLATYGLWFSSSVAGHVSAVLVYVAPGFNDAGGVVGLWDAGGDLLAQVSYPPGGSGFVTVPISPVAIVAGTVYIAGFAPSTGTLMYTPGALPVTNGPLSGTRGSFRPGFFQFPVGSGLAEWYGVDVVFDATPVPPPQPPPPQPPPGPPPAPGPHPQAALPPVLVRFQFNIYQSYVLEFGVDPISPYMRVIANGGYVTETPIAATAAANANPLTVTVPGNNFAVGDNVFAAGFLGMSELDGRTFTVAAVAGDVVTLNDIWNRPEDASGMPPYAGGGTLARIYTSRQAPYQLKDLPFLKYVQSADVMTLCCVNQADGAEYPPADLARHAPDDWQYQITNFASAIGPPTTIGVAPTTTIANADNGNHFVPAAQYAYVVTAVDANGEESIASPVAYTPFDDLQGSVDMSVTAGGVAVTWTFVTGAVSYNIYRAPALIWNTGPSGTSLPPIASVPIGSAFGFVGSTFGNEFVDQNIFPDWTTTPPLHLNPFSRGQIQYVQPIAGGNGYLQQTTTVSITSPTGSGAVILPVVQPGVAGPAGGVAGYIVQNPGGGYQQGDQVVITGQGSGAAATAIVGPETGTWPSVPGYFQSRRGYAATLNNPDTMWFSQTGAYTNMDASLPPIDTDSVVLTPWGQQVNTIQWMIQGGPGGLLVATGLDVWQVSGTGGQYSPLTPASESAIPQESNGFTPIVPPIRANYDLLFVQELGYTVRDIQYNFFTNIYAGQDLSILSNHLFEGFNITSWSWSRVPWQIVWTCRSDGRLLSLTYDKELQLFGWARHDTNGLFMRTAVATEPPVDVSYFVVQRFVPGVNRWAYFIERMDDHFWDGPEEPWCIDCGLELIQPAPAAALSAAAATGPGTITGGYLATGGQGYTQPGVTAVDPTGQGSGFKMNLTVTGGVITGFVIIDAGHGYSPAIQVVISDAVGDGATFVAFVTQNVRFAASENVFSAANIGDIIRIGGGQAQVTALITASQVEASITVPIVKVVPNDPNRLPVPAAPGEWTITTPVTTITGLEHLEGFMVTGLADGEVIPPMKVVNGRIELPQAATSVKVGLAFTAQLQALHLEEPSQGTIQGKRKRINGMTVRMERTRGIQIGANQPVAAALDHQQEVAWSRLVDVPEVPNANIPAAALPLFSGDKFQPVDDDWQNWNGWEASPGMVAAQQTQPLPMNITALVPTFETGDTPG